jgi:hypothetical protein
MVAMVTLYAPTGSTAKSVIGSDGVVYAINLSAGTLAFALS